jgi:hypothetical protein
MKPNPTCTAAWCCKQQAAKAGTTIKTNFMIAPEDEAPVEHEFDFGITIEDESAAVDLVDNTAVADGLRRQYEAVAAEVEEDAVVPDANPNAAPEKSIEELMAELNSQ